MAVNWTGKTEFEVSKKIARVLQKGMNEKAEFAYQEYHSVDGITLHEKPVAL